MTDRETQDRLMRMLKEADWDDITQRLLLYVNDRLRRHGRTTGRNGWTRDDFICEGIGRVIRGVETVNLNLSLFTNLAKAVGKLIDLDAAGRL